MPSLGFIAHMDTSPSASGENVKPREIKNYQGGDIVLNKEKNIVLSEKTFPYLKDAVGSDLLVTDGTTLLGADDKAGDAEIMAMAEYFLTHPEVKHGEIELGFTPDEEVGMGPSFLMLRISARTLRIPSMEERLAKSSMRISMLPPGRSSFMASMCIRAQQKIRW